jgi:hypothetical protein
VTTDDHVVRNRVSRERLIALIARLGERTVVLPDGWTAATALAHLAFWDRYSAARLERHLRDPGPIESMTDATEEFVNAAGLPQWTSTPLGVAAADVVDATATVDRMIETLPADVLARIRALNRPRLLDRALHRDEHLDHIERALG